jgi:hypothetical protein
LTNSGDSPLSNEAASAREVAVVVLSLTILICGFAYWIFQRGYILYWGDAQAHLKIGRSLLDSRQPGMDQLGTVWLPSLHLLVFPFAQSDWLWSTGLAGTIPVAGCFVVAGTCLFLAARHAYQRVSSAVVVLCCFALNPNMLYLSSIPMTETVFLAGLALAFLAILRFKAAQQRRYFVLGLCACWFMSLTRYDGWFLIPFIGLMLARSVAQHRARIFLFFCAAASLAPLLWIANSWWQTSNALDFVNGPYSAAAIQGGKPYPGWHNWRQAVEYYFAAGRLCTGWPLLLMGTAGGIVALRHKQTRPGFFLFLTPAFYVWSMHSSANPIHVPVLWPFSYYNTRYGIAVTVFAAFACGALPAIWTSQRRRLAFAIPLLSVIPWLVQPSPAQWICWKESEQNSISRRAWTSAAAGFFGPQYKEGDGILASFSDITGIFCKAAIPLREVTHEGIQPDWLMETAALGAVHPMKWAIAQHGDHVWRALRKSQPPAYTLVLAIKTKDAPDLEIYRRNYN